MPFDKIYSKKEGEYSKPPEKSVYYLAWKQAIDWIQKSDRAVELGCGVGQFADLAFRSGVRYIEGLDISREAIKRASKIGLNFTQTDITKIKFPDADVYFCFETLEHIEDDLQVIKALPSEATFIFSVPDFIVEDHKRCFKNIDEIKLRYLNLDIRKWSIYKVGSNKYITLVYSIKKGYEDTDCGVCLQ